MPRIYLPTAICGHMHNWAGISGLERPTPMPAQEKMPRRQFRRIITTLCHRWHIPAYSDYVSESDWPAFSRLDDAGQHAFWRVLGAREVDMPPHTVIVVRGGVV